MIYNGDTTRFRTKLYEINWLLPGLLAVIGLLGVAMLYSAEGGNWNAGPKQHLMRLCIGMIFMIGIGMVHIRIWFALAYPIYVLGIVLLIGVDFFGETVNNSQRWLDLGMARLQPSELMKIAMALVLARYYHDLSPRQVSRPLGLLGALVLIIIPMQFIFRQPDLGTTLLLVATGLTVVFLAGLHWRWIVGAIVGVGAGVPLFYQYGLKDYQRSRILTLLDPSRDPRGEGYHIIQSKIALGSGGVTGKGFGNGSQGKLNYVPENRTDFIFTVVGEEFGLWGGWGVMMLYMVVIGLCIWMASECKQRFSRLLIVALATTFMLYVVINLAMVMGLIPVVGVPLPLISYGGTVILAVLGAFGLILSAHVHRDSVLPRGSGSLL